MKPTTFELLQQHLRPAPSISEICVRDFVATTSGTRLSVQASHFHYCRPRDDVGPYTRVEVMHPDAPEKWTVKPLLMHIIDTERVFAYRPLSFMRDDRIGLPGFNKDF